MAMNLSSSSAPTLRHRPGNVCDPWSAGARALHFDLLQGREGPQGAVRARAFLQRHLEWTEELEDDLPRGPAREVLAALPRWCQASSEATGARFQRYLSGRRSGAPRQLFRNHTHALYVLRALAPTKLVDGSWLYGLLPHWRDRRLAPLIRTYLEELGDGVDAHNHVAIYLRLLARHGCEDWQELPDAHFVRGCLQLALAAGGSDLLPEVVGYNLGYEQLPLHLLITVHELRELGIDPWYFSLHITIDNAHSGHARLAIQALQQLWPVTGESETFMARVRRGYRLNQLGPSIEELAAGFDLDREFRRILSERARLGRDLHGDHCRLGDRPLRQWLAQGVDALVDALERHGWIQRHQPPRCSRFWRLLHGSRPAMLGVFSPYELAVIHDWIAGRMPGGELAPPPARSPSSLAAPPVEDSDARQLEQHSGQPLSEALILEYMSPRSHYTPGGLAATRCFRQLCSV